MPVHGYPDIRLPLPDERATLDRMPGSAVPVIRQPFRAGDMLPYWAYTHFEGNLLYDVTDDPGEEHNLAGTAQEDASEELLRHALGEVDAPAEQYERLGLI